MFLFRAAYRQFVDEMIIKPGARNFDTDQSDVTAVEDHVSVEFLDMVLN